MALVDIFELGTAFSPSVRDRYVCLPRNAWLCDGLAVADSLYFVKLVVTANQLHLFIKTNLCLKGIGLGMLLQIISKFCNLILVHLLSCQSFGIYLNKKTIIWKML